LIALLGGGLLFDRHQPPLTRRHVVYYCAALYMDYDRWRNSRLGSLTEFIEQQAISRSCGDLSGLRVLDLGCGDGTYAIRASEEGAVAVGLDISAAMLRRTRIRATAGATQVIWCQASIAALPFTANAFDVVIAVTALCFSDDPGPAIKEAARVLRPGGSLAVGELGKYSSWAVFRRVRGWLGSRMWSRARFWSMQELRRVIEAVGLRVDSAQGCVYYPPVTLLARVLGSFDPVLSHLGELGAAFIAVNARKP
jgi:ubiquinone/menaquinone biosynthesis C-methylase UbiE